MSPKYCLPLPVLLINLGLPFPLFTCTATLDLTYVLFELLELLPAIVLLLLAGAPDPLLAVATRGRQSITACNGNEGASEESRPRPRRKG